MGATRSNGHNVLGRKTMIPHSEISISTRVTAGLMVIIFNIVLSAAVIAFTFKDATNTMTSITMQDMPSLMNTFHLVRESKNMEAITPDILAAPNKFVRDSLAEDFKQTSGSWNNLVTHIQKKEVLPEMDQLITKSRSLHENITKISDIMNLKMEYGDRMAQSIRRVRRVGERLNALDHKQFSTSNRLFQSLNQSIILLLVANAANSQIEISSLEKDYRANNKITSSLLAICPHDLRSLLTPIFNEILRFGEKEDSIFWLSTQQLTLEKELEDRLVGNKFLSTCIVDSSNTILKHITLRIEAKTKELAKQLTTSNYLAVMLPVISILCSLFIILYLKHSVIARMVSLKNAMLKHVKGKKADICISGNDEIAAMGKATSFFIDEIQKREEGLRQSHDELEIRVQQRTQELKAQNVLLQQEIVERLEAESALRESESRFRLLAENLKEMLCIVEIPTNSISYVNKAFRIVFGSHSNTLIQAPSLLIDRIHPEDKNAVLELLSSQWGSESIEESTLEYRMISPDNSIRWLFSKVIHLRDESGAIVRAAVMAEDITNRKNNEKRIHESEIRLKYLSTRLLEALEEDRRRLATELHDDIGPSLGTVKFGVENVVQNLHESQSSQKDILHTVIDIVKKIARHIGKIQMELRPSILDDLGVVEAVDWYCQEYRRVFHHIKLTQHIHTTEELIPKQLGIVIYRVVQEALNNIAKHSEASKVELSLTYEDETLLLRIEDNGKGFDLDSFISTRRDRKSHCLGLVSMRERIELSEGKYSIFTAPSEGTCIEAEWIIDPTTQVISSPKSLSIEDIA